MKRAVPALVLLLALMWPLWTSAQSSPWTTDRAPRQKPWVDPPLVDDFGWRLGLLNGGYFGSGQGRPLIYFDTGLRLKTDSIYLDIKAPGAAGLIDFMLFTLQGEVLDIENPFNFIETLNKPIHYGAFLEVFNVRLGPTWTVFPFADEGADDPLRISAGIAAVGDFVFFDLLLRDLDADEFEDLDDPTATDPAMLAVGGFVALGGDAPLSEYDFALGVGYDVFTDSRYIAKTGLVLYLDFEWVIGLLDDVGAYVRVRTSTYTHITTKIPVTMAVNYGVVLRL